MSIRELQDALRKAKRDDALVNHFVSIWPLVQGILQAFSKATGLPIFGFLDGEKVFQSSTDTMPPFCREMLSSKHVSSRCIADGQHRAMAPSRHAGQPYRGETQYCHAGMLNGRCDIDTGALGTLSILFGSRKANDDAATAARKGVIDNVEALDGGLADRLKRADVADQHSGDIEQSDIALMNAITGVIEKLIATTVGLRSLTINMAHELSMMMVGMGLLAEETEELLGSVDAVNFNKFRAEIDHDRHLMVGQCKLGLYVVRNFLSHASETRYADVMRPRLATVDLNALLEDIVDLHRPAAKQKHIVLELADTSLPKIVGLSMELQRLFHNVLNNAVKYSYHSIPEAQRVVRIWAKVPYDPGFAKRRFAIVVENYGLGVAADEVGQVFKAGFRGRQAAAEVVIGSGIGLSEALKIMNAHHGSIKIRSKPVHESEGRPTYVTTVELIFPYQEASR